MTTRILLLLGFSLATLHAADPAPADLLRQGLFEEEANQNLDKAAEHYRAVIAAHDRERALAAAATFRLGEIARKKNDKEAAAAAFRTVTERFPEQQEIARRSRENLAALGIQTASPAAPASADPEDAEIARLKELARNSPDLIDGAGTDGWRPLHHAAASGWTRVMSYLLENKADPNSLTVKEQFAPLHLASVHGHLGAVKVLLAAKADPNVILDVRKSAVDGLPAMDGRLLHARGSWTALDLAIVYDRRETALVLIEAGANIQRVGPVADSRRQDEFNTLMLAIYLQRNNLAQALIDAGSPLAAVGKERPITPLGVALRYNKTMVAPLLKAGADPNLTESADRYPPLIYAGSIEIAKLLVEAGADVKAAASNGMSPLHAARSAEMAEFLISKGADPNAKSSDGLTSLDLVASQDEAGANAALFETLLKHGATVADPRALVQRTSPAMLPLVRERIGYPKMQRPDAILLSVDSDHSPNSMAPPRGNAARPVRAGRSSQSHPDLIVLETRPSPASPPPSLAEVLCEAFMSPENPYSVRILRRGANDRLDSIREWTTTAGVAPPTDWPALEWGDIVEVISTIGKDNLPSLSDFAAQIPARTVTFRLGDLEIPKTIPGSGIYWLDAFASVVKSELGSNIEKLADPNRFVVHRKGSPKPIIVDFSESTETRFRLLDGDTVEMSWNVPGLDRLFSPNSVNYMWMRTVPPRGVRDLDEDLLKSLKNLSEFAESPTVDYRKICILRRAENWKLEIVDFKAWLDKLPPSEKWDKDTLVSSAPKLNPGDAVILIEDQGADAEKRAAEILNKTTEVSAFIMFEGRQNRPRVVPPIMPQHVQPQHVPPTMQPPVSRRPGQR